MFDRIIAEVKLETPDPSRWRAQLHNLLGRLRAELIMHPGMAAATMVDPPRTEVALRLLENLLGILLAGGLDAQDAAWAADILAAQVTYAAIEAELRRTDPSALAAEITANFARLPAGDFPLITAHAAQLVAGDADARFRFAIDVVIDGVLSRASRQ
jgi:Tetracyclin repressor-like, C-terminal domain